VSFNEQIMTADTEAQAIAAIETSGDAQGIALATLFIRHIQDQGNAMMRYVKDLFDLSLDGRKAFRVYLTDQLSEQRAYVKSQEDTPQHAILKRSLGSATVRQSEAITISKAFDAGFNPLWEHDSTGKWCAKVEDEFAGYHALVAFARGFLESNAAGPTQKRGRPAKDKLTKAQEYLSKLGLEPTEIETLREWLAEATPSDDQTN